MSSTDTPVSDEFRGRRLRLGLLVDGLTQPAWVVEALRQILAEDYADIVCVVINGAEAPAGPPPSRSPSARAARLWGNRKAVPFALYKRFDNWRYPPSRDPEAGTDVAALIPQTAATLTVVPRMTKFCDYFPDDAVAWVQSQSVDVFLRLGFRILKGPILSSSRFGVWSFHHGDNTINRGGPAGFWELFTAAPTSGAVLQRLSEELDAGHVMARSFSSTNPHSFRRNRANFYWQAGQLLPANLRQLYEQGPASLQLLTGSSSQWEAYSQPLFVAPKPLEVASLFLRLAGRLIGRKLLLLVKQKQWFIAYRYIKNMPDASDVPDGAPYRFKELMPPRDRIWADPFPVAHDGRRYLFFEEFLNSEKHAHISVLEFDAQGNPGPMRVVLERPYHLSYPNVFRWNDTWYMVPETYSQRRVELYRSDDFPFSWTFEKALLEDIDAVDSTLAEIDGTWWLMLATLMRGTEEASALHLFHADSPLGPWTPHRRNPVKVDVRSARPAGKLFRQNGRLYRPAQDGSPTYGTAMVINEILEITPTTFREVEVARIDPVWRPGLTGTHTINAAGGLTVIDARQWRSRWR
ncbi:MAG: hypothetical protein ABJE47_15295 [bacterium]